MSLFAAELEFPGRFIHYQKTFKAFFPPGLTHFQGIFKGLQHLIGMKESRVVPCGKQCHRFKVIINKQTNKHGQYSKGKKTQQFKLTVRDVRSLMLGRVRAHLYVQHPLHHHHRPAHFWLCKYLVKIRR